MAFLSYAFRLLREARLLLQYADHMDVKALSMIIRQNKETGPSPRAAGRAGFMTIVIGLTRRFSEPKRTDKNAMPFAKQSRDNIALLRGHL